ncbi:MULTISPECIES: PH domain-containing protein [unclassified Polaribacter]|uniref:PH domain-containing protein n=1 Tax=unclassified Polaribacter TaxID=196858 RepID=UPI0011BE130A|nr:MULTISPECIES: PH domain-containing protein [unclassified Polaribacter]TXD51315.1 PH domain-containing protein [Polaribacter sp. IC063]TXD57040.1 PH domain-containing protein [Polaribacter sp. IC066]
MTDTFQNNTITSFPDITKTEFKNINKLYLKVMLINFSLVFMLFLIGLIVLHQQVFTPEINAFIIAIYLLFLIVSGSILGYLLASFAKRKYAIREKDISYQEGLLVKRLTTVPFSRIQHVETDEKPISRIFGLSSLSVYTAGDSSDDLVIKGITKEEALQIKEFITTKINE